MVHFVMSKLGIGPEKENSFYTLLVELLNMRCIELTEDSDSY